MQRKNRLFDELRPFKITRNYLKHPEGSVLVECGDTKVICTASIEENVPIFLKGKNRGWITAEYALLPRSTDTRTQREGVRGKPSGRTFEIQRLIGRSLRSVIRLSDLGERTIWIDCDVIQADGGTRTASITGSFIALIDSLIYLHKRQKITLLPVEDFLAAVSVGIVNDSCQLDLDYREDSAASVDLNVVMTGNGDFVEVQGTAEGSPFSRPQLDEMLDLARKGISELIEKHKELLGELTPEIQKSIFFYSNTKK